MARIELLHRFLPLLLILHTAVHSVTAQTSCYPSITDLANFPLPGQDDARYLQSEQGKQVIVPEMRFDCVGSVTAWSAHTLVLTLENFVEFLTHSITFQVWRPDENGQSYTNIGSNELTFQGMALSNNVTYVPNMTTSAFFSFHQPIPPTEQIHFLPGDVVGWFIESTNSIRKPLSPLFRGRIVTDCDAVVVDMHYANSTEAGCVACNLAENSQVVSSMVPLVAVTTRQRGTCTSANQVCNATVTTTSNPITTPPSQTTPTTTTTTTVQPVGQTGESSSTITASDIVCIVIATITLVLHVIIILLCAANLAVMKQIRTALRSKTMAISPGVRSPSAFKLGAVTRTVNHTPADYGPAGKEKIPKMGVMEEDDSNDEEMERMSEKKQPLSTVGDNEKPNNMLGDSGLLGSGLGSGSQTSFNKLVGGGSQTSFDRQLGDSRTGSREDLLNIKRSMI